MAERLPLLEESCEGVRSVPNRKSEQNHAASEQTRNPHPEKYPKSPSSCESSASSPVLGKADLRIYRKLEEDGYLRRPPAESDNAIARALNSIFEPTPVRIGKTTVACSIITAIKKGNPLCLLNPMVLSISW
jgi:hypothetical protein